MTVRREGAGPDFARIEKEMKKLQEYQVIVGFFGEKDPTLLEIVRANEYGTTIKPHNKSGFLWVPSKTCIKEFGRSANAKNVKEQLKEKGYSLFVPKGKHVAVTSDGKGKLTIYFYLMTQIDIPARSFMRKGWIENRSKYQKMITEGLSGIWDGSDTAEKILDRIGSQAVADMRRSAIKLRDPKNAPMTVDNKGSDNPLVDTGELERKITYEVVKI